MYVSVFFFIRIKMIKLILVLHSLLIKVYLKLMMSFRLYTLSPNVCTLFIQSLQLFPLEILDFFNEF
jgi:hypothetical protein